MCEQASGSRKLFLLASTASVIVSGALGTGLPRGVAPEDAKLYLPSSENTFKCITHPSIIIPFANVNDDYCDCPDGSDEPGTSACAHLQHTQLAIKGYYCANRGHIPGFLPLNRVNDGICDYEICCDGSDEYDNRVKCENRCKEIGQEARKLLSEKWKIRNDGSRKRKELVERAGEMRKEIEANIRQLESQISPLEDHVKKLEEEVKVVEEREAKKLAEGVSGRVKVLVETAQGKIDELKSALEEVRENARAAREQLTETEWILKGLRESYNPNFNDDGVKAAVRKWDDYAAAKNEVGADNANDASNIEELISGPEIDWEKLTEGLEDLGGNDVAKQEYLSTGVRGWLDTRLENFRQILVDNGILAEKTKIATAEPKAVTEAKAKVQKAQTELNDIQGKIKTLQDDLSKDYGPNDVFRSMKGKCISRDVGEYKYEYCFLEKVYQKSLKDSSSTFLGEHKRIEIADKNESSVQDGVFPADDIMNEHQEKLVGWTLIHENGARCWNGPARSVKVELYCSTDDEVRSVVEEEKCVYRFEVGTPVVCEGKEGAQTKIGQEARDEL